jgi:hypothetical protein
MVCADFLAGVSLEAGNRDALLPCLPSAGILQQSKPQKENIRSPATLQPIHFHFVDDSIKKAKSGRS